MSTVCARAGDGRNGDGPGAGRRRGRSGEEGWRGVQLSGLALKLEGAWLDSIARAVGSEKQEGKSGSESEGEEGYRLQDLSQR